MRNPLSVAIVKPINGACNLCCHYCYMNSLLEPQRSARSVMTMETLSATIDFFCSHQDEVEFTWHGGEPLLAGKEFYREVAKLQKPWVTRGKTIANFLQTNGTLVDRGWSELFKEIGFFVGVSLDAPLSVHDRLRVSEGGRGSIDRVLAGISYLKESDNFNGVICCVGRRNVDRPKEVIGFFLEQGIKSIKFLRIKDDDQEAVPAMQYANFLIEIFNLWLEIDDPDLEIRDIKTIVDVLMGGEYRECSFTGHCDQYVTVYSDGAIFACDRFVNEPRFQFGTVFDPHPEVLRGNRFRDFLSMAGEVRESCYDCRWYFLCKGGCLKDRLSDESTDVCQANRRFFERVETSLKDYGLTV